MTAQRDSAGRRASSVATEPTRGDRSTLMHKHAAARARRDSAPLGSEEFRAAAEEVAALEIAIAQMEEPPAGRPTTV